MKKPYSIKCNLSKETLRRIPERRRDRRVMLQKWLSTFVGKDYPCPVLGGRVKVIKKSVSETANHACLDRRSTICAMMLPDVIKNARLVKTDTPKTGRQTKEFFFKKLHVLEVHINYYGDARLTVGERAAGNFVEYCITHIKIARQKPQ